MIRLLVALTLFATPALAQHYGAPEYGDQNNQQVQQQYNPMEDRWETTKGKKDLTWSPPGDSAVKEFWARMLTAPKALLLKT